MKYVMCKMFKLSTFTFHDHNVEDKQSTKSMLDAFSGGFSRQAFFSRDYLHNKNHIFHSYLHNHLKFTFALRELQLMEKSSINYTARLSQQNNS